MIATEWMATAACGGAESVFDEMDDPFAVAGALKLCARCPVVPACLAYTLLFERRGFRHGVAGGLTAGGREKLVRGARARKRVSV